MSKRQMAKKNDGVAPEHRAELGDIAIRVRGRLQQTALGIIQIGADLTRAKELLGHGNFGPWLDREFGLGRRSGEQFMAAARRFGTKSEIVSHLPAGAVLELSAPSVPDELVERVIAGDVPASPAAIRRERTTRGAKERASSIGASFLDLLDRFGGDSVEVAAGIAAHALRRWKDPEDREWLAKCLKTASEMIEGNLDRKVPPLEFPRTTARRLTESASPGSSPD